MVWAVNSMSKGNLELGMHMVSGAKHKSLTAWGVELVQPETGCVQILCSCMVTLAQLYI